VLNSRAKLMRWTDAPQHADWLPDVEFMDERLHKQGIAEGAQHRKTAPKGTGNGWPRQAAGLELRQSGRGAARAVNAGR
jgi:hypothetical protein